MASSKKSITEPFSRMKNGLAELQRWWPSFVKNDGIGGLTIDPVLYRTKFSASTNADEGGFDDEASQAGIRVEAINDDGTEVSNNPTITISGAGTLDAKATINHDDGSGSTVIRFTAPSSELKNTVHTRTAHPAGRTLTPATETTAPFPVFMTIQELAEMLDTYRHIGDGDENKRAFLPHGLVGGGQSGGAAANALPSLAGGDPRESSSVAFPATSPYRATVFMPMMLDNNQFDKRITGARTDVASRLQVGGTPQGGFMAPADGITRYDADPEGDDSSTIRYKTVGYSGDHLIGLNHQQQNFKTNNAGTAHFPITHSSADHSFDGSASHFPKYRTRCALAMFLKNGTYTLKGGVLIPYTYDPDREIGGVKTNTVHAVWDGKDGQGEYNVNQHPAQHQCSAQILPMFDFLQPPICSAAQGGNFDFAVVGGSASFNYATYLGQLVDKAGTTNGLLKTTGGTAYESITAPRGCIVRNNPMNCRIKYIKRNANRITMWLDYSAFTIHSEPQFANGMPIFMWGLDGALGGADNGGNVGWRYDDEEGFRGDTEQASPDTHDGDGFNHNGWWIITEYEEDGGHGFNHDFTLDDVFGNGDTTTFRSARIIIQLNTNEATVGNVAAYEPTDAYICAGLIGGFERDMTALAQNQLNGDNKYGIRRYRQNTQFGNVDSVAQFELPIGTGAGYLGGANTSANNVQSHVNHDHFYPSRITIGFMDMGNWDEAGTTLKNYTQFNKITPRQMRLQKADDSLFVNANAVIQQGTGSLRLPAPFIRDYGASRYYSRSQDLGYTYGETHDHSHGGFGTSKFPEDGAPIDWAEQGLHIPLWSFMDTINGRHAWDYIKPIGTSGTWLYGRNRPFPAHERIGTRLGYNGGVPMNTTKYGLTEMGCSQMWLDMEVKAFFPFQSNNMVRFTFDTNENHAVYGRHALMFGDFHQQNKTDMGFLPMSDGGTNLKISGTSAVIANGYLLNTQTPFYTAPRTIAWFGSFDFIKDATIYQEREYPLENAAGNCGWGSMNNGYGTGDSFTYTEGYHTLRTVFNSDGMTLLWDGKDKGTDTVSAKTVWGLTISNTNLIVAESNDAVADDQGNALSGDNQIVSKSATDLQIDEIVLRSIPTSAMLPFKVHTMKQQFSNVARYTSLTVEAENVRVSNGMNIKATLMTPSTGTTSAEGVNVIAGFENIDLLFSGGVGSMDLTNLPASAITDGFVIRFEFIIPTQAQTEFHPINWDALPIIRNFTVEYDEKPTASVATIGNTFNGDITGTISTRVGHIISFRGTGTTTDVDRTISDIKFVFGDGSQTDWIAFADQTTQSTTYDIAHSYLTAGTYTVQVYSRDDSGNESDASTAITVEVANAPPVALLRAVPSMVRAGQPITFDGSSSYDINAGGSISDYTFTFGDGSSAVSGSATSAQHTYAYAGEYQATLVVQDSDGTSSQTASVVVKVLPATLVIPLVLNTKPRAFTRTRTANMNQTTVLDSIYPELTDLGQRTDEFTLEGSFLKDTANLDIEFMEELHLSGALVEIIWEEVNFVGTPTGKTFVGRMLSFDYQREGGRHGETPYTAVFVREAGLGA